MRNKIFLFLLFTTVLFAKVDINNATADELFGIKGMGCKSVARIIEYRSKKCFETTEEIKKVKRIGEKTFSKIKDEIEVLPCKKR